MLVLTSHTPGWKDYAKITSPNHQKYCDNYGYNYKCIETGEVGTWGKIIALLDNLEDLTFWIDLDAIFRDFDKKLEDYVGPRDLTLTTDKNGLNTGAIFIRKSEWSCYFLNKIWDYKDYYNQFTCFEQTAMAYLLYNEPQEHWTVAKDIQKFSDEGKGFILHLANQKNRWTRLKELVK